MAVTSVVCFTSSALVALLTHIPVSGSLARDLTTLCAVHFNSLPYIISWLLTLRSFPAILSAGSENHIWRKSTCFSDSVLLYR